MMAFEILPLDADTKADFFTFFSEVQKNDVHSACMCTCWNMTEEENDREIQAPVVRGEKDLRTATKQTAEKLIDQGRMGGYLAYASGAPVGWCNANDKSRYPQLTASVEERVMCIMCFEVLPSYRNCGVASALLRGICDHARREGYTCVEAYPNKCNMLWEDDYKHVLHMYQAAGFSCESRDHQDVWVKKL